VKPKLLLIDGHAYAYRAFFAIRSLRSPKGQAVNAVYGFIKMLGRLRDVLQPSHLVVVWDGGLSQERLSLVAEYKAQRPEMPDELSDQIELIQSYLGAAGVVSLQAEGTEADDWIATLAIRAAAGHVDVVIASSDKDFFQLVSPQIGLMNPADKSEKVWSASEVVAKTGVSPHQIVDWLSLMGDAVDNIAGVPGVGPKTAAGLMATFGSVDGLYSRIAEVKSDRLRAALEQAQVAVRRNQKMIRLFAEVPGSPEFEALQAGPTDYERLVVLFRQWGFKRMLTELEARGAGQQQLFAA